MSGLLDLACRRQTPSRLRHARQRRDECPNQRPRWTMAEPIVVIVGAGPAGMRAAEAVVQAGLRPIVVDERPSSGGQIYRRQPPGFTRPAKALYGFEADKATRLHRTFDAFDTGSITGPQPLYGISLRASFTHRKTGSRTRFRSMRRSSRQARRIWCYRFLVGRKLAFSRLVVHR